MANKPTDPCQPLERASTDRETSITFTRDKAGRWLFRSQWQGLPDCNGIADTPERAAATAALMLAELHWQCQHGQRAPQGLFRLADYSKGNPQPIEHGVANV